MDRPILPRVERPVSRLILGQSAAAEDLPALYDRFVELGGNAFETARWYPTEPVLGEWLAGRRDRDELFVITKGCHPAVQDGPPRVNPEAIRTGPGREPDPAAGSTGSTCSCSTATTRRSRSARS